MFSFLSDDTWHSTLLDDEYTAADIKVTAKTMSPHLVGWKELNKYFSTTQFDVLYLSYEKKKIKQTPEIKIHNIDWLKKINELKK